MQLQLLLEISNKDSLFIAAGLINLRHEMGNWKFVIIWKDLFLKAQASTRSRLVSSKQPSQTAVAYCLACRWWALKPFFREVQTPEECPGQGERAGP